MSRRGLVVALAVVLVAVPLTGCFGDEEGLPSTVEVNASQPLVTRGWAYDGQAVTETTGQARLVADNETGSGSFAANLTLGGTEYTFSADSFEAQPGSPWTANGVNQSVTLHGDTGQATPVLPAMDMVVATWGPIQMSRAGELLPDPLTGEPVLFGHVMVTDTGVRSDEDQSVKAQDGSVYAPDKAGDGRTVPGDQELHLEVTSAKGATAHDDTTVEDGGQLTPQQTNASTNFPVQAPTASANVSVSVAPPAGSQVTPAQVNATLLDPSGSTMKAADLGANANASVTWTLETLPSEGNYTIELDGNGAADWNATMSVSYPEPLFFHAVFEQVTWKAAG